MGQTPGVPEGKILTLDAPDLERIRAFITE